ncbi:MAG: alpha/beta hydrolase [Beijerinckiaceae bacterium]|nr:alpha/beta hydrolase [Beijerinckiaceae bacterium]
MSQHVEIDGHDCVYELTGHGPCLTLLHSVGLSTREGWRYQRDVLAQHFQVLAYDIRGLGQSSRGSGPVGADRFAHDLGVLLTTLGIEKTALMGVSLGGFVAQKFAALHPERVTALVLVSTAPKIFAGFAQRRSERNDKIRAHGMNAAAGPQVESHFPDDFLRSNPDVIDWYKRHYLANDPEIYIEVMDDLGRYDSTGDLTRIVCPTLIVAGEADHSSVAGSVPLESARALQAGIKDSQLVTIPGAFHYPHIDHAGAFNAVVAGFLQPFARS